MPGEGELRTTGASAGAFQGVYGWRHHRKIKENVGVGACDTRNWQPSVIAVVEDDGGAKRLNTGTVVGLRLAEPAPVTFPLPETASLRPADRTMCVYS